MSEPRHPDQPLVDGRFKRNRLVEKQLGQLQEFVQGLADGGNGARRPGGTFKRGDVIVIDDIHENEGYAEQGFACRILKITDSRASPDACILLLVSFREFADINDRLESPPLGMKERFETLAFTGELADSVSLINVKEYREELQIPSRSAGDNAL